MDDCGVGKIVATTVQVSRSKVENVEKRLKFLNCVDNIVYAATARACRVQIGVVRWQRKKNAEKRKVIF